MGQTLSTTGPDVVQQFKQSLSLAATSKSDKQRQESLSHLTNQLDAQPPINPVGTQAILAKLLPLVSDSATPVRSQLLKLFRTLPEDQVRHSIEPALLFVRAGLTHLSADISNDALGFMDWLLDIAGDDIVSAPGGWVKTLNTICATLGWYATSGKDGWSSGGRGATRSKDAQNQARRIDVLTKFLRAGFAPEVLPEPNPKADWENLYRISRDPNGFAYLNLTGSLRDEEGTMYSDRESRQRVFHKRFLGSIFKGLDQTKKEGGLTGRAASNLEQTLVGLEGMGDYEPSGAADNEDLLHLW
jgi:pre-rRNA-processing protein IPI1